ncbi:hypothetical protein NYP18_07790 [Corynebacterium sp. YIM 101645]|uniref:Uncharacterized protein n=1 Tax=Corynebacterium lemuris TaxID=1859292 RepID=A0ABT2FZU4_9CORY|nr:hypothetical protein [Corynebacterium lemuris]MCS5479557.1 hypothetical protein [Corynebacterium lemuris]
MNSHELRTMTLTLRGARRPFRRNLAFAADMPVEELLDRTCIALGRYPTPDAVFRMSGTFIGRGAYHFSHPNLRAELMQEPLAVEPGRMQLILDRLGGWIFDITVDENPAWSLEPIRMELTDTVPLLPGPQIRLPEFNAVMMVNAGDPLPPDLERAIIVDALLEHMAAEVPDPASAMELYTVLSEAGRPFALPEIEPLVRTTPDVAVLFELLRLATGESPPRLTKPGFLPVKYTRQLVEQFPVLRPVQRSSYHGGHFRYSYSSRDAELLTSIIELGRRVGVLAAGPGEQLTATDFGREVLTGEEGVLARLKAEILRARIGAVPYPPVATPESPGLTFAQFLEKQDPPVRYERGYEDEHLYRQFLNEGLPRDGWREPLPF